MARRSELLWPILLHPEDDAQRLIYADWLEEHGDGDLDRLRAEFIRVQIELANYKRAVGAEHLPHAREERLKERERELAGYWDSGSFVKGAIKWNSVYEKEFGFVLPENWRHTFHRGFIESVECSQKLWLKRAGEIMRRHPVTRVHLTNREPAAWVGEDEGLVWSWDKHGDFGDYSGYIDPKLFDLLRAEPLPGNAGQRRYDTAHLALADLGQAAITYGRRKARLEVKCNRCGGIGKVSSGLAAFAGLPPVMECLVCKGAGYIPNPFAPED